MTDLDLGSDQPYAPLSVAVVVGVAAVAVPTLVSEIVWPGWSVAGVSATAGSGIALFGALLGLSGLCVVAVGVWVGSSAGRKVGTRFMLGMYGGVVFATGASVLFLGWEEFPLESMFLAYIFSVLVGIPFWVLAGLGLALGMNIYNARTQEGR